MKEKLNWPGLEAGRKIRLLYQPRQNENLNKALIVEMERRRCNEELQTDLRNKDIGILSGWDVLVNDGTKNKYCVLHTVTSHYSW